MKQNISKKQWDELNYGQKFNYLKVVDDLTKDFEKKIAKNDLFKDVIKTWENRSNFIFPFVGQMIEYLGKGWYEIIDQGYFDNYSKISNQELCNLLWEAVKYKIK